MDGLEARYPDLPERIAGLGELACNLWWSWHPQARDLFKIIDSTTWKQSSHNPVKMLHDIDKETLDRAAQNSHFLRHYDAVIARFRSEMRSLGGWFPNHVQNPAGLPIAYFSAEFGLHHSLPFYAGGLGFLAGDFLKESSDLSVPVIGIGFMYPGGYLRQRVSPDGWQSSESQFLDKDQAPISRVMDREGKPLVVRVPVIEPPIYVGVWKLRIGKVHLYLMDTDIEANDPWNRSISARLYVGDAEQRLRQEIVLGIGGARVLSAIGIKNYILHLNEGHPAFAILERTRMLIEGGMECKCATDKVKATTIFTTHTPVPAGHDVFPFYLMEKYFNSYFPSLGLERDDFFQMGIDTRHPGAGFNMTAFAMRTSSYHNCVSRRHKEVAREMWSHLWPDLTSDLLPIDHVTNGVHLPTWIDSRMEKLFNRYLGPHWLDDHDDPLIWQLVDDIPDAELWRVHQMQKMLLITTIRERARLRWTKDLADSSIVMASGVLFDPYVLTIGFARRFATYKRATLILNDLEHLRKIMNDQDRPVQILFAGKAHPSDDAGKQIIQEVFSAARDPIFGGRLAFVEDFDEQLAQYMVHGVDLWLNNPLPPLEACGTSGMKATMNGVPQLSIMDGWWIEGFNGKNGWAFAGSEGSDRDRWDASQIYRILEEEVIPRYYAVDNSNGIPHEWVKLMKEAIKRSGPEFCTRRMVKEYANKFYQPALQSAEEVLNSMATRTASGSSLLSKVEESMKVQ